MMKLIFSFMTSPNNLIPTFKVLSYLSQWVGEGRGNELLEPKICLHSEGARFWVLKLL